MNQGQNFERGKRQKSPKKVGIEQQERGDQNKPILKPISKGLGIKGEMGDLCQGKIEHAERVGVAQMTVMVPLWNFLIILMSKYRSCTSSTLISSL